MDTLLYRLRFFIVGALMVGSVLLLPFMLSLIWEEPKVQAASHDSSSDVNMQESPNLITQGMFKAADGIEEFTSSADDAISSSVRSATNTIATATVESSKFVARGVSTGASAAASGVGSGVKLAASTAGNVAGFVADTPPISSIIKADDNNLVPVINDEAVVKSETPSTKNDKNESPKPQDDSEGTWPIHGTITTSFGVPHWPYQPIHTGIDISDGRPSGITPVKPFKAGQIVSIEHSYVSLGNHIVIDHGGGITSVYGHLASISVKVGQEVSKNTVLGHEGSTGASTGTHLHFEIRVNGTPVDPHKYVNGRP